MARGPGRNRQHPARERALWRAGLLGAAARLQDPAGARRRRLPPPTPRPTRSISVHVQDLPCEYMTLSASKMHLHGPSPSMRKISHVCIYDHICKQNACSYTLMECILGPLEPARLLCNKSGVCCMHRLPGTQESLEGSVLSQEHQEHHCFQSHVTSASPWREDPARNEQVRTEGCKHARITKNNLRSQQCCHGVSHPSNSNGYRTATVPEKWILARNGCISAV